MDHRDHSAGNDPEALDPPGQPICSSAKEVKSIFSCCRDGECGEAEPAAKIAGSLCAERITRNKPQTVGGGANYRSTPDRK